MTVRVSKPVFNLRDKLSELDRPVGNHGTQLMQSADAVESFNLVGAGRKNLIINGSCMVDNRNSGGSSSVTSGYAVDRTHIEGFNGAGAGTGQQVTDAPAGFLKSLKVTVTTVDTSLGASDFYTLRHIIEGQNVAHLGFGTMNAKTVTLSFWVKSSMAGIFCCSIGNGSNNKTMPKEYNINAANTWEYKTITFPGATTGTWGTDNGRGISIRWCMGVGSTRIGTVDTYNGNEAHGTSKQMNLFATNGSTFQITGMQLEEGKAATPFEHRSFGEEIDLCRRYYSVFHPTGQEQVYIETAGTASHSFVNFPIPYGMRTQPSITLGGTWTGHGMVGGRTISAAAVQDTTNGGLNGTTHVGAMGRVSVRITRDSGGTYSSGQIAHTDGWKNGAAWLAYSAEM